MYSNSDIVNTVDFLHNSPRRHHLAQARIVRVASVLSGVLSPRREIFRLSEELFSPRREYFCSGESIFAQVKIDLALWTTFVQAINFRSGEGYFRPGEIGLAQAKKK